MIAIQEVLFTTGRIAPSFGVYAESVDLQWPTNIKLDRANKTLQDDYTLRVKLGMADLNNMEEAVTSWSLNEGCDSFKGHKTYCLRDWTGAWQWHAANPQRFHVLAQTYPEAYLVPAQQH